MTTRPAARPPTLLPLAHAGAALPLVFMPDLGNNVLYAQKIVAGLPPEIACFAMRLDRELISRLATLELAEIAATFARDLQASSLAPPYRLAGHSFAGLLAFETAVQLERSGESRVEVLLLDTGLSAWTRPPLRPRPLLASLLYAVKHPLQRALDRWRERWEGAADPRILHDRNFLRVDLATRPAAYHPIIRGLYRAMAAYAPGRFSGTLTLFRATRRGRLGWLPDDLGWGNFCDPPIHIIDIECNHMGMVHEASAARQVADRLAMLLLQDGGARQAA